MDQQGLVEWGVSASSCGWLGGGGPGLRNYGCVRSDGWFGGSGASLRARNGAFLGVLVWVCWTRGPSAAATAGSEVGAPVCGARGMFGGDAGGYFSYYQIQNYTRSYYGKET